MKPSWKDAPSWAKWLAQDEDGNWFWYDEKPDLEFVCWSPNGKYAQKANLEIIKSWTTTLEERP